MVSYQSGGEVLRPGARVAFSGRITVNNELVPQGEKLRALCGEVGLVYKTAVSQTGCDAVIADSLTTAKVRRAADYGKPIVSVADFSDWVLANQPDHSEFLSALFETPPEQSKTLVPLAADSIGLLASGKSAWVCKDRKEFLQKIDTERNRFPQKRSTMALQVTLTLLLFTLVAVLIAVTKAWYLLSAISGLFPIWLSSSRVDDTNVPVFYIDQDKLSPLHRQVLGSMQSVFAEAAAYNQPISASYWRELTGSAMQSVDAYLQTGDLTQAQILGDQIALVRTGVARLE
ncbi:hypothetical protein [Corynebacterium matruchotii]|uniref:hypothetical protein n=1 Tax=Corynebacterium matruchotii TaxID=43768 RepID=UPI0028F0BD3C|nr:hypothetical protein [Corynebacterium matruchotii]